MGKTTVAAALAVGLVKRGHSVHLSTTDPAAHLTATLATTMEGLQVDRIDPKAETDRYISRIMSARSKDLDKAGLALLREDLRRPALKRWPSFTLSRASSWKLEAHSSSSIQRRQGIPCC